ncbi:MAG: hypothetical protein J1F35_00090 [Erysipelotrichales bacterium]|nr:hypothetical protein [Erysipelotrichales bacterium]
MIRVLTKSDLELLIIFYKKIDKFNEESIRALYDTINDTKILIGNVINNKISSILTVGIIKNNYYLQTINMINDDYEEIKDLINYAVSELRRDERGLNIIYENFPYKEIMHDIMIDAGFKCNFMNLVYVADSTKVELIKPNIALNDKSEDVKKYIYKSIVDIIKINDIYFGTESLIPDINTINLENTNVAVIRNDQGIVVGTLRFGIVSDSLFISGIYADNEEIYKDLITLVKNLTNRNIEVGVFPSRVKLINTLENLGFKKFQTDYILKLN